MNSGLHINNLSVAIDGQQPVISDFSLHVAPGTTHALMAPNGAGKSSLFYALMGHPRYAVTRGSILFNDRDLIRLTPDKRAQLGIFLAWQHPLTLPGVTVSSFLHEAVCAGTNTRMEITDFHTLLYEAMEKIDIDRSFANRAVNDGFSGGEKKRLEMLQLLLLKPHLILLDEIDSGLDIDAVKSIAQVLQSVRQENPELSVLVITHYQKMLEQLAPEQVHIMQHGTLVHSGSMQLVHELERKGYDAFCR